MGRVVAIANQKGGVGKTTTAVNLGASLAAAERRVLVVDMDPQANATSGLGLGRDRIRATVYDVLVDGLPAAEAIVPQVHMPQLDVLPGSRDLVGADLALAQRPARERLLREALAPLRERYDFVLVDCPPSLGLLTLNTLVAADGVLIPIQCEFYALEGLSQLLATLRWVQKGPNPALQVDGVLLTMYDGRLNLSRQVAEEAREYFGPKVYRAVIPRNVRIAEAPSFGKPILLYDVLSVGARSYLALAREILAQREALATTSTR